MLCSLRPTPRYSSQTYRRPTLLRLRWRNGSVGASDGLGSTAGGHGRPNQLAAALSTAVFNRPLCFQWPAGLPLPPHNVANFGGRTLVHRFLPRDNQGENRIASSRNAPQRPKHCLTRMLPSLRHFVNRAPTGRARGAAHVGDGYDEPAGGANDPAPSAVPGRITGRGHRRPRLSRVAIITLSSAGFKYPGGLGAAPPCCQPDRGGQSG
jgi:hypothetical protein